MMQRFLLFLLLVLAALPGYSSKKRDILNLLHHVYVYANTLDTINFQRVSYSYGKATLRVDKRNPILMLVPHAYVIARGDDREFFTEIYSKAYVRTHEDIEVTPLLRITTVPRRRSTMREFRKYLAPNIYAETIIGDKFLSPFHPNNFRFYRYNIDAVRGDTIEGSFWGRRTNTQLIQGNFSVDGLTGRIISCTFEGNYDMIRSYVSMEMNESGYASIFPKTCEALVSFRFMGNRLSAHYTAHYGLPKVISDTIKEEGDPFLMSAVRPDTLTIDEQEIYKRMLTRWAEGDLHAAFDTVHHKRSWAKRFFWDAIGDNVLNRINTNFGENNQGYLRLNPVLNPLYMSYSRRRGFTYKFDLRSRYQLSENSEISGRIKAGYAFKQKRFYYRIPLYWFINKHKNRYVWFEIGNNDHIGNQQLRDAIAAIDTTGIGHINADYLNDFSQMDARLSFNYDINDKIGFKVEALFQRRSAEHKDLFRRLGWQTSYNSFSPMLELQVRPWGWTGPIFTVDYDHGLKGILKSNISYDRWEFNAEYIHRFNKLQSWQMRIGSGFYTHKGANAYFLYYENFHDNNLPGGWNDDWSGEFELLRGETYNNSDYYFRTNVTYESPLLLLSRLPLVGRYMKMERIYISALEVRHIHPYVEIGYGFTTRLASVGVFFSNRRGHSRLFGIKFGFELFHHW